MVRQPYIDSNGMKKGGWSKHEDDILRAHVERFGHPNWRLLPILAGLARCGKSCRLRWMNYLKPGLKHGKFTKHEEDLIIRLHNQLGKKWSIIAANLPGRTDNEVKNYWHAHINKPRGRRTLPQEEHQDQQNPTSDDVLSNEIIDPWSSVESCDQTRVDIDPSLFLEEEAVLHHDVSNFSDSSTSDGVIYPYWNNSSSTTAESEAYLWSKLPLEEDTYDMVLW